MAILMKQKTKFKETEIGKIPVKVQMKITFGSIVIELVNSE